MLLRRCAGAALALSDAGLPDVVHSMPFVEQTIKWLGPVWNRRVPDMLVLTNMGAGLYTVIRHPRSGLVCRRVFLLCAYLFLLRSVCVVSTSLPDMSDHCQVCS